VSHLLWHFVGLFVPFSRALSSFSSALWHFFVCSSWHLLGLFVPFSLAFSSFGRALSSFGLLLAFWQKPYKMPKEAQKSPTK
jgi:hypothetical protein